MEQDPNAEATAAVEQQGSSEAQGSEGTTKPLTKGIRPPFTYTALIALALRESPEGRLPLRAIYRAITRRFPYYRLEEKGWQNCVRHNLSLNECFLKVPMPRGEGKRGNLWSINPAFQSAFERGNYRGWRRRARVPQVHPPPPPFPYYFHYQPPSPPPPTRYLLHAPVALPQPYSIDGYRAHPPLFPSGVETFNPLPPFPPSPISPHGWVWQEGPYSQMDL